MYFAPDFAITFAKHLPKEVLLFAKKYILLSYTVIPNCIFIC